MISAGQRRRADRDASLRVVGVQGEQAVLMLARAMDGQEVTRLLLARYMPARYPPWTASGIASPALHVRSKSSVAPARRLPSPLSRIRWTMPLAAFILIPLGREYTALRVPRWTG